MTRKRDIKAPIVWRDGSWHIDTYLPDGTRLRRSLHTPDKMHARLVAVELITGIEEGRKPLPMDTLDEAIAVFLHDRRSCNIGQAKMDWYAQRLGGFAKWLGAQTPLAPGGQTAVRKHRPSGVKLGAGTGVSDGGDRARARA